MSVVLVTLSATGTPLTLTVALDVKAPYVTGLVSGFGLRQEMFLPLQTRSRWTVTQTSARAGTLLTVMRPSAPVHWFWVAFQQMPVDCEVQSVHVVLPSSRTYA